MVLNKYRHKVDSILTPSAKAFAWLGPDGLSILSLICAFLAALILILWEDSMALVAAFVFVTLNGFFDAIDGKVANITGKSSPRGDLTDHVIDRYADFIIIAGISLSSFADVKLGLLALGSVMIASYMGTQSQALGLSRDYSGILGRAERLLFFMSVLLLQYIMIETYSASFEVTSTTSLTLLDLLLILFIIAANLTTIQRFIRAWRALS